MNAGAKQLTATLRGFAYRKAGGRLAFLGGRRPCGQHRAYAAAAEDSQGIGDAPYVSPYAQIFDAIDDGKTFLGTSEFKRPEHKFTKSGVPEYFIRFKTTAYGRLLDEPFVRPNEHKVTLQVKQKHLPLTETEMAVLKEIVGTRLNEQKGILQLSSVQFGSRIENKRHVVSMLDRVVENSRTLAKKLMDGSVAKEGKASL